MKKITVIGGTSGFGKWMAEYFQKEFSKNIELTITGTQEKLLQKVSQELSCKYSLNNIEAVKNADITIFSVPISKTQNIISQVGAYIKPGSIVLDVTSIKQGPTQAMKKAVSDDVLIIPTHPMFGPYITSLSGQTIILTPEKRIKSDNRYKLLKKYLLKSGAKIEETTPKEHDKMMAIVQGLTHYNMFIFGETLNRLDLDIEKSLHFVSPIYKGMISSVARYMNHNPTLYGDIQIYNTEVQEVRNTFLQTANDFNTILDNKNQDNFVDMVQGTQKHFGKTAEKGQVYTDKLIHLMSMQSKKIINNIGNSITCTNIYSSETKEGVIESFLNNIITFTDGESIYLDQWEIH